ncbi:AI-2E family transporter [Aliidiomarina minuta]|uniref:AI-2E family transporter n=1 Tax=Aliidiomarina minuta TaxID=880057 RepID=A0A432W7I4_9GAMM|nr:AI-2E family transporter [Aliidiomarina minuta]RUO26044.1 AI-2E family transporter [Aliidiomarina minuta]
MQPTLENRFFLLLLATISIAFMLLLMPFWGAIFWSIAVSILFYPLYQWIEDKTGGRSSLAAVITLLCCVLIILLPLTLVSLQIFQQAASLYEAFEEGEIKPADIYENVSQALPFIPDMLQQMGINIDNIGENIASAASASSQYLAEEAFKFGRGTMNLIISILLMLYLTFFLLRDGKWLADLISKAIPLEKKREDNLSSRFVNVTRATIKGSVIVAVIEGALGGFIFAILGIPGAFLWGVVMGLLSLVPAIGAFLIWVPVAIYLFVTGDWGKGLILTVFGTVVIGLTDNILRPILVGRNIRLPDYLVLFSILGGIVIFGVHGLVIGPILAALFVTIWGIFMKDFDKNEKA